MRWPREALRRPIVGLRPLWVAGLVALALLIGRLSLPHQAYRDLWLEYLLICTAVPAALVVAVVLERSGRTRALDWARTILALLGIVVTARFLLVGRSPYLLLLVAAHLGLVAGLRARRSAAGIDPEPGLGGFLAGLPAALFVSLAAWAAAVQLIWWAPWDSFLTGHRWALAALAAALIIVVLNLHPGRPRAAPARLWPGRLMTAGGGVLLAVMALRDDGLFDYTAFHHWGYYAGPAELVRQGHWLLWDVPSQYGFLSTAVIALLPTGTAWQSLFLLNGLLNALCAIIVFVALRSLGSGVVNLLFALAVAMAAEFLRYLPQPVGFPGPIVFPSTGGLRFIWLVLLMALLLGMSRPEARPARWFAAGCAVWLVGVLWSAESAVYCSAIWIPACALLAWRAVRRIEGPATLRRRLEAGAVWVALPPAVLGLTALLLSGYYLLRLGHPPDWRAFTEFVTAYQAGYQATAMELGGVVWVLLVLFVAISTAAHQLLRSDRGAALGVWGAWGGLAVTASYFLGRSHASIVQVLSPVFVMSLAMILQLVRDRRPAGGWVTLMRIAIAPVLTMLLVSGFGDAAALGDHAAGFAREKAHVNALLPRIDPGAQALLSAAQVRSEDPITFVECYLFPARMPRWSSADGLLVSDPRSWLPTDPYGELLPLSGQRLEAYLDRFVGTSTAGGWFMECRGTRAPLDGVLGWLGRHYDRTRVFENAGWRLTRYEPRPRPAGGAPG